MLRESSHCDRRAFLAVAGGALAGLATSRTIAKPIDTRHGITVSQQEASETGMAILASGGNAVDAVVAAALVGCVVNISKCGIGGYGGHMMIGLPDGKATSIDFNSTAPAAARPDMFPLNSNGTVKGNINERGWLASGVPGTLAGLQLALDKYGTLPLADVLRPAIQWTRNGIRLPMAYPLWRDPAQANRPGDAGSARLFSRNAAPLKNGETFRNPDLADMLQRLAEKGSVEPFYRGEIARHIADEFKKNGGIVTAQDMASYEAREVPPLVVEWRGHSIATAPLTAGGLSILQAIASLKALGWHTLPAGPTKTQAWLEALRIAWGDRLNLLGDPEHADVPIERLLSEQYAQQSADKVKTAIVERRPVQVATDNGRADGTLHVSAVDSNGMMASATLTHGNSFGAKVVVDGLGLVLGHGMSRFDPVPGRPNSIAPFKRPLHNMCPTIVFRDSRPVLALGAVGGRRIPNAVFQVLLSFVGEGSTLEDAVAMPRLHTEGGMDIHAERTATEADIRYLKKIGYTIRAPIHSMVFAVERTTANSSKPVAVGVGDYVASRGTSDIREPHPHVTRAQ